MYNDIYSFIISEAKMVVKQRKKSPRAPSIPLEEAIKRAVKIYESERLHPAPSDIVAQHMGYKDANNGRALGSIASLRYFGLLERTKDGVLSVSKNVESYNFAPDKNLKQSLLLNFLKHPSLYGELLEKYDSGLPSDANLKYELIQKGFSPQSADIASDIFKKSVIFADYFDDSNEVNSESELDREPELDDVIEQSLYDDGLSKNNFESSKAKNRTIALPSNDEAAVGLDQIPVRLTGGRRAWIVVPTPFYDADKARLKAQIDLLLTDEDDSD